MTSLPRALPDWIASKITEAGSAPSPRAMIAAPERCAQIPSCSAAAARNVSPAAKRTLLPFAASWPAIFPIVVVFPHDGRACVEFERAPAAGENAFENIAELVAHLFRFFNAFFADARAQFGHNAFRTLYAEVGEDERLFQLVHQLLVDAAAGENA